MTNERRGTEKLLDVEEGLCSLTAEELLQVAGGYPALIDWPSITRYRVPYFPLGTPRPDLFRVNSVHQSPINVELGKTFGNGF